MQKFDCENLIRKIKKCVNTIEFTQFGFVTEFATSTVEKNIICAEFGLMFGVVAVSKITEMFNKSLTKTVD